jgi:hypothetical protein
MTGVVLVPDQDPRLGRETVTRMYEVMNTLSVMDHILYEVQRQGWGENKHAPCRRTTQHNKHNTTRRNTNTQCLTESWHKGAFLST